MMWQRDVDLVVPLWQGGDDVRVAQGASALARLVPSAGGSRLHVSVTDGPREKVDKVRNLQVVADTLRQLRERVAHKAPVRVLTLGGDCLSDVAAAEHLAARHKGMVVYWVDAHADLNTPDSSPSGKAHGMGLRLLLGEGHPRLLGNGGPAVPHSHVTLVGTRDLDPGEEEFARSAGLEQVDPVQVIADPSGVVSPRPQGTPAYVHLDMDVCDPVDLPAVSCPSPQGPRAATVAQALAAIAAHHDVVGVGVCEYVPVIEHDTDRVRALLAALGLTGDQG
ncbi:arginase family protein [Allosalinactinospora lopnorensis]|uniref:arginase family protein n=1 Tax=Allosalinactinospora lopnorensis TaxID=1352348 RepID=UPI000623E44F|nr:arginase family protein [Allosalinactinospora lopnorensis]